MTDIDLMQDHIRAANPIPHVDDLDTDELAHFVTTTHTRRSAIMQTPTQRKTRPATPGPPARRRNAWVFAAAFAAVLLVTGLATLVLRGGDTPVTNEPATQTTAADSEVPTTVGDDPSTVAASASSLVWSRVPLEERLFRDKAMKSVTTGGPGFVAVGSETLPVDTGYAHEDAAVWTSPDGITWTQVPSDEEAFGGEGFQVMEDVTVGGPGLVAVGVRFDEPGLMGLHAAVWTSADGATWSAVPRSDAAFRGYDEDEPGTNITWMRSVTAGGPGLVAVGSDRWSAAVWTSPDGIDWTRVPHDPDVFGLGATWETHSSMDDVAVTASGLVAVGGFDGRGALWTSTDGVTWSVHTHDLDVNGVAAGGPGFVAVGGYETTEIGCHEGAGGDCHAVVWISPDGTTWTQVPYDEAVFGSAYDKQMMSTVTTFGSDLIAVGTGVWISRDGITWTQVFHETALSHAEQTGMRSVTVGGSGLVAVGEINDKPAAWIAVPGD